MVELYLAKVDVAGSNPVSRSIFLPPDSVPPQDTMSRLNNLFFSMINRAGNALPRSTRRRIADFPGVLGLFQRLSKNR